MSRAALSLLFGAVGLALALSLAIVPGVATAQSAGRVGVLRSTGSAIPAALANDVDAALLRDLRSIAGIEDPMVSPVEYAEIQLSVGCSDETRGCLETIARTAEVSALVVRELSTAEDGTVRLELRYFDAASTDPPAAARSEAPLASSAALTAEVPSLVRRLFGIPEVAAPAPHAPAPEGAPPPAARADDRGAPVVAWTVIGAGAVVLTAGIVVGAVAASDYEDWKKRPIDSMAQADEASDELDALSSRALVANVLMPVGVVALGVGVALLLFDAGDDEPAPLDVAPSKDGAVVTLRGAW